MEAIASVCKMVVLRIVIDRNIEVNRYQQWWTITITNFRLFSLNLSVIYEYDGNNDTKQNQRTKGD